DPLAAVDWTGVLRNLIHMAFIIPLALVGFRSIRGPNRRTEREVHEHGPLRERRREQRRRIEMRFDADGIEIPFPLSTFYRSDGQTPHAPAAGRSPLGA